MTRMATQIANVIAAHAFWKGRLRAAATGAHADLTPEIACRDDLCTLGAWLRSAPIVTRYAADPVYRAVCLAHTLFHEAAGDLLASARQGDRVAAFATMQDDFMPLSDDLVGLLRLWKEKARSEAEVAEQARDVPEWCGHDHHHPAAAAA